MRRKKLRAIPPGANGSARSSCVKGGAAFPASQGRLLSSSLSSEGMTWGFHRTEETARLLPHVMVTAEFSALRGRVRSYFPVRPVEAKAVVFPT